MKKIWNLCLAFVLMLSLTACGGAGVREQKELTHLASFEETTLELLDATVITTEEGVTALKMNATYQNNGSDGLYALCSFAVKAFQNDTQLNDVSNINGNKADLIREVKNGTSLQVCYLFELSDDSEVEVLVCTPTASEDVIAKKVYAVDMSATSNDDAKVE